MSQRSIRIWAGTVGIGAFVLLRALDYLTESDPVSLGDFLSDSLETALMVGSAVGVALLTGSLTQERAERDALMRDLEMARAEGEAWRGRAQTYVAGLGAEIEKQLEEWQLTQAEREVGLLMLKGFAHSEIAKLRGTTEATVRHQARAVYQKSGMPGRSAFCAYFLEDLLPPKGHGNGGTPRA